MAFLIQSILLCALFTVVILKNMKDPIQGILSYPPAIRRRVENLPQYQSVIQKEKRAHLGKKLLSIPAIAMVLAVVCRLSGMQSFPMHSSMDSVCFSLSISTIWSFLTGYGFAAAKRFVFQAQRIW